MSPFSDDVTCKDIYDYTYSYIRRTNDADPVSHNAHNLNLSLSEKRRSRLWAVVYLDIVVLHGLSSIFLLS